MIKTIREFGEREYKMFHVENIDESIRGGFLVPNFRNILLLIKDNGVNPKYPVIAVEGTVHSGYAEYETDLFVAFGKQDGLKFIQNLREFCEIAEEYLNGFE
jgi:hypothetical protein